MAAARRAGPAGRRRVSPRHGRARRRCNKAPGLGERRAGPPGTHREARGVGGLRRCRCARPGPPGRGGGSGRSLLSSRLVSSPLLCSFCSFPRARLGGGGVGGARRRDGRGRAVRAGPGGRLPRCGPGGLRREAPAPLQRPGAGVVPAPSRPGRAEGAARGGAEGAGPLPAVAGGHLSPPPPPPPPRRRVPPPRPAASAASSLSSSSSSRLAAVAAAPAARRGRLRRTGP